MTRHSRLLTVAIACLALLPVAAAAARLSDAAYYDKVRGCWLGKCIGGALGMPLEGWRYPAIDAAYPEITGYVGYFEDRWLGWSGINDVVELPAGGGWQTARLAVAIPAGPAGSYAVPILGMSFERSRAPGAWHVRAVRLAGHPEVTFDDRWWQAGDGAAWGEEGVTLTFTGLRAWLRLRPARARALGLAGRLELEIEARCLSGAPSLGVAFDYRQPDSARGFGPDDDTSYEIVALHALERYGPGLTSRQIAAEWLGHVPHIPEELAEGRALQRLRQGLMPPESGRHGSGEAIGGQMRGEIWGLVCPGRPDLAAEYARRDAEVSHRDNGVYGEQFVAAMTSAAFIEPDPHRLIEAGLRQIPPGSRYAGVIREVIAWHRQHPDWRETRRLVLDTYPAICNPVYGEAGIVALALLYGGGDFERTITIAARCGNDTDCNTATVGALLGCITGAAALPPKWTGPVDDEFRCFARGLEQWRITDLSRRICSAGRQVEAWHADRAGSARH